jgi:hypothetical protein
VEANALTMLALHFLKGLASKVNLGDEVILQSRQERCEDLVDMLWNRYSGRERNEMHERILELAPRLDLEAELHHTDHIFDGRRISL